MLNRDGRSKTGDGRDGSAPKRRKMTVSDALKWAWGEELPKVPSADGGGPLGFSSAWGAILRYGELHSIVDRQPNQYGCIPFDRAGWPHADALSLAEAVRELAECEVEVPAGWNPMPELVAVDEALGGRAVATALERATIQRDGALHFRMRPDVLVVRHAILGMVPDWRLPRLPEVEFEKWENGRHRWYVQRQVSTIEGQNTDGSDYVVTTNVEVDGWSSRLQRPVAGAFRRPYFDPDPVPAMVARADYEIFCSAMMMLHDTLSGQLDTIDLVAVDWPAKPWEDSGATIAESWRPRILPDLRTSARPAPARKRRVKSTAKRGPKAVANPA